MKYFDKVIGFILSIVRLDLGYIVPLEACLWFLMHDDNLFVVFQAYYSEWANPAAYSAILNFSRDTSTRLPGWWTTSVAGAAHRLNVRSFFTFARCQAMCSRASCAIFARSASFGSGIGGSR